MAPLLKKEETSEVTEEVSDEKEDGLEKLVAPQAEPRKYELVYTNLLIYVYGHLAASYGLYLACTQAMWHTIIFNLFVYFFANMGVTAGAHRLWSHRAYKAKMPLQILLMVMNSLSFQNAAVTWVRDHRLHHRYSDTDADPHNAARGFFYSHIGWLFVKKHPEVKRRGKLTDMSDIYANPVLMFQHKYLIPFNGTICFLLPTIIPVYFWGESLNTAWHVAILRFLLNLHMTFLINSAAHMYGNKPYDLKINPTQNRLVSLVTCGEGFHNYHHVFPWDYRAAELGNSWLNATTLFIDFFAWLGWAYDVKTVPDEAIRSRAERTGDGSYSDLNKQIKIN